MKKECIDDCRIEWPSLEKMNVSAALQRSNRLHGEILNGMFGVMDGKNEVSCS